LLGRYENDAIAVIIFSATFGLTSFSMAFLHRHIAIKTEWHGEDVKKEWMNPVWWSTYPGSFFALVSILISFFNVSAAIAIWLLLPVWVFFYLKR
jgi:hypothetical protein